MKPARWILRSVFLLGVAASATRVLPAALQPIQIAGRGPARLNVHVAYEPAQRTYLVAWEEPGSGSTRQLKFRLVSFGALPGPEHTVASIPGNGLVGVVTLASRRAFAIGYSHAIGRAGITIVSASQANTVIRSFVLPESPTEAVAIGGEIGNGDAVPLLYRQVRTGHLFGQIRAARVQVAADLSAVRSADVAVIPGTSPTRDHAISRHGGAAGRWLVTWVAGTDLLGTVIFRNPNASQRSAGALNIADGRVPGDVVLDGDGTGWLVAYSKRERTGSARDVFCRRVVYDPFAQRGGVDGGEVALSSQPGVDEFPHQVARLGESHLVAFARDPGHVRVASIDPSTCAECEPATEFPATSSLGTGLASVLTGGSSQPSVGPHALRVSPHGRQLLLMGQFLTETDGQTGDLRGGCGSGGETVLTCPRVGNAAFTVRLRTAPPSRPAVMLLGFDRADLACGPCVVVPSPVLAVPRATSSLGTAGVPVPIPDSTAMSGLAVLCQWTVDSGGGGSCLGAVDLSAARIAVIEP